MEDMKSKFFKGASDVKEKFETSQELNDINLKVRESQNKRTNYILEIGEAAYTQHRKRETIEIPFTDEVKELDKKIFDLLNVIEEKIGAEAGTVCECGNDLTSDDKFCKECGKKVEELSVKDPSSMLECSTCKTLNSGDNNYCNSCGYKLV